MARKKSDYGAEFESAEEEEAQPYIQKKRFELAPIFASIKVWRNKAQYSEIEKWAKERGPRVPRAVVARSLGKKKRILPVKTELSAYATRVVAIVERGSSSPIWSAMLVAMR